MLRHPCLWLSALSLLPAACSNGGDTKPAVSGQNSAAPENQSAAVAAEPPSANAAQAAGAPGGVCPFATRNWRVTLDKSEMPGGARQITIRGEIDLNAQGRVPQFSQPPPGPHEIFLDVDPDPTAEQPQQEQESMWGETGMGYDYDPAYTHAVVRCAGREIARIPIPRG